MLLGEAGWTASADEKNHVQDDEKLRCKKEQQHVEHFIKRIHSVMGAYLDTDTGKKEIDLLRKEIERARRSANVVIDDSEILRKNVYEIYKDFTIEKGSDFVNREGLKALLTYLDMTLSEQQFQKYLRKLKFTADMEYFSYDNFFKRKLWHFISFLVRTS